MKNSKFISALSASFLVGAAITFFLFPLIKNLFADPPSEIRTEIAKELYYNHRVQMGYENIDTATFKFSGYFDLNIKTAEEIVNVINSAAHDNVRIYFSQVDPDSQTLILNELSKDGKEVNSGKMVKIENLINHGTECPKFCEFDRALLSK